MPNRSNRQPNLPAQFRRENPDGSLTRRQRPQQDVSFRSERPYHVGAGPPGCEPGARTRRDHWSGRPGSLGEVDMSALRGGARARRGRNGELVWRSSHAPPGAHGPRLCSSARRLLLVPVGSRSAGVLRNAARPDDRRSRSTGRSRSARRIAAPPRYPPRQSSLTEPAAETGTRAGAGGLAAGAAPRRNAVRSGTSVRQGHRRAADSAFARRGDDDTHGAAWSRAAPRSQSDREIVRGKDSRTEARTGG